MKKLYAIAFAALSVFAVSTNVFAQTTKFVKIQQEPVDWTGTYLIVYEDDVNNLGVIFNGSLEELDAKNNFITASNDYQKINGEDVRTIESTPETDAATFYVVKSENEGYYNICSASGSWIGYNSFKDPAAPDANLKSDPEKRYDNTIAMQEGKTNVIVTAKVGYELRWNPDDGKTRFRYHEAGKKKAIKFYQKVMVDGDGNVVTAVASPKHADYSSSVIYNLSGQKLSTLHRGINIINGKKVVK